jgi:two-component system response regulator DegU
VKVLIVEDNRAVREFIKTLTEGMVDQFVECSDGFDAAAIYGRELPDLVLMDISMNFVNGLRATEEIVGQWPSARIMMMTGKTDPGLREAALKAGAIGFVHKENLLEIHEVIRTQLLDSNQQF